VRTTTRYLLWLFAFAAATATVYWLVTGEPAGTLLLLFFGLMPLTVAAYGIRHGALRERSLQDDPDASPQQAAGQEVGTFPTTSAWPIFLVAGAIVVGASLVYGLLLLPPGLGLTALAIVGLMRESRH
jgi:Cytochrome c oxidase subunit IV